MKQNFRNFVLLMEIVIKTLTILIPKAAGSFKG